MDRGVVSVRLPLGEGEAQGARVLGVVGVEALGEDALEDRHGEERARGLDEGEPLGVVAGDGGRPGTGRRAGRGHQRASSRAIFSGIRYVTATGNRRGVGSA